MTSLVIAQFGNEPAGFEVVREHDGKRAPCIEVPSPYRFGMTSHPDEALMSRLRWYFEEFLAYPFPPRTEQAANIEDVLEAWGRQAFDALFASGLARDWIIEASRSAVFRLEVLSDDPATLSWPWEALCHPDIGVLAHCAQVERRLNCQLPHPPPPSGEFPKDTINILLVTARPYDVDAQFRSISYPLVELIEHGRLAASVHLLRPPTLDNLREHLARHPHTYHVLHFDGHGSYREGAPVGMGAEMSGGAHGELVLEDEYGNPAAVTGNDLGNLLREHSVPIVVLNACQSAMIDQSAIDPFASAAGAMLRSGVRSVVAMAYSLYVRAAQEFLPAFYEALFQTGSVSEAARKGRLAMSAHPQRSEIAPKVKLRDWLVPVVYQQEKLELSWPATSQRLPRLTREARDFDLPQDAKLNMRHAFTGRDGALLELERAMRQEPAGILIHGLAGIGKTTLARAFVYWLRVTEGLGHGCFWFAFDEIHSADHVLNEMGRSIVGSEFGLEATSASLHQLVEVFREKPFLIVWDNFESVRGVSEVGMPPTLSASDQGLLSEFLSELRGASTKVLITSRSQEEWLSPADCYRLRLRGLRREEMWDYAGRVLDKAGIDIRRDDAALGKLLESLGGHPLAMQVVLPHLATHNISDVRVSLEQNLADVSDIFDLGERRLFASLKLIQQSLPDELARLLIPLALHERFVDTVYLETMAASADKSVHREHIERFVSALVAAGLLTDLGSSICEIHPLLPSFLRVEVLPRIAPASTEDWRLAFVEVMAGLAKETWPGELDKQRPRFAIHQANFHAALLHARKLQGKLDSSFAYELSQALGCYAYNLRNFAQARELFVSVVDGSLAGVPEFMKAQSYNFLAEIARNTGDFVAGQQWYFKILQIKDKGDEEQRAATYWRLAMLAREQGDFTEAENFYFQVLQACQRIGDQEIEARCYQDLGATALEQKNFTRAKKWFDKMLQLSERLGDQVLVGDACWSLGILGVVRRSKADSASAKTWFLKALEIADRLGDEKRAANAACRLGGVAESQHDFTAAENWFRKALELQKRLGDEESAASTYHSLGLLAFYQDIGAAEQHFLSALQLSERTGDEYNTARNYSTLGAVAKYRGDFAVAEKWCLKGLEISKRLRYEDLDVGFYRLLGTVAFFRDDYNMAEQWNLRALELSEKLGDQREAAGCYQDLGMNAFFVKGDFGKAEKLYLKALRIFKRTGDTHEVADVYLHLGISLAHRRRWLRSRRCLSKALAGFLKTKDTVKVQRVARNFLAVLSKAPAPIRGELRAIWKRGQDQQLPPKATSAPIRAGIDSAFSSRSLQWDW